MSNRNWSYPRLALVAAVAASCAAPKDDSVAGRADSGVDAVTRQRQLDSAGRDSLSRAPTSITWPDSMPNAKPNAGSGKIRNAGPTKPNPEPMPNAAATPTTPPAPDKKPPTRVVPDPVRVPPDTGAAGAAPDSVHDSPSDYRMKRPERRRVLPPIKP